VEGDVQDALRKIGPILRSLGFRGSGQNFRKAEGDFIFVINFQSSSCGSKFYVNLGAQPVFIPAEEDADLGKLKEYECALRRRVGVDWPWDLTVDRFDVLVGAITSTQADFFGHAQTLRSALAADPPDELIRKFSSGTTAARAALHLARAAAALGHRNTALLLVARGMELASDRASGLRDDLEEVRAACLNIERSQ
jgi:hypothetical protein